MGDAATTPAVATLERERPYAPSWVNRLTAWFQRLPGPDWLAYLVAMPCAVAALTVAQWQGGQLAAGTFTIEVSYYAVLPFAVLLLIDRLDRAASHALRALRPLLGIDDAALEDIHYRLTVAPARPAGLLAAIAAVLTAAGYVADPVSSGLIGMPLVGLVFRFAWESLITAIFVVLVYHTLRQLRLIAAVHERITRFDVFDQGPLYAMSRVTASTAIGLIVLFLPSLFLLPADAGVSYLVIAFAWYFGAAAFAAAAFVLPLRGMHDRLVAEKRRHQGEIGRRISVALDALQVAVDSGDGPVIEARSKALASLVAARDVVNKVPTWPWSAGALTGFGSAILLPIVLFLVQRVLAQVV